MKTLRIAAVVAVAASTLAAAPAFAGGRHHHHHHKHGPRVTFGFHFGAPLYPRYYAPAYYYGPPAVVYHSAPVVVQAPPQVYTERSDTYATAPQAEPQQYWHYCAAARGYYPYVKECPHSWERVPAAPR